MGLIIDDRGPDFSQRLLNNPGVLTFINNGNVRVLGNPRRLSKSSAGVS